MRILMLIALLVLTACGGEEASVIPGASEIAPKAFGSQPIGTYLILDVRTPAEYAAGHLKNALNVPHDRLADRISDLRKYASVPVLVYCKSGKRSALALEILGEAGFSNLNHLSGDMDGWLAAGYLVTKEVL